MYEGKLKTLEEDCGKEEQDVVGRENSLERSCRERTESSARQRGTTAEGPCLHIQ